jgi:undecaprenyl-diphosphatase
MGETTKAAGRLAKADVDGAHAATRRHDGPALRFAERASDLADQPPLIALSAATIAVGAVFRQPVVLRSGVRMLASHLIATGVKTVLKSAIDRTRPSRAVEEGHHIGKGDGADDTSLNSFPSGHTAGAVAVAQAVAVEAPRVALPLQLAAVGVGMVQPSQGKHYLSDVAAGAAIGWLSARVTAVLMEMGEAAVERGVDRWQANRR